MLLGYLILITIQHGSTFTYENRLEINDYHLGYIKSILDFYSRFSFLVHLDGHSEDVGEYFLKMIVREYGLFIAVYNGDHPNYPELKRPYGIRFINLVVYSNPWKFQEYLLKYRNAILYDNVIFIIYKNNTYLFEEPVPFWNMQHMELVGNMIVIDLSSEDRVVVHNKCYYCKFKELTILENTTESQTSVPKLKFLPSNFTTLQGYNFLVSYLENFPYMYCKRKVETANPNLSTCDDYHGSESRLLEVVSARMNTTFNFVIDKNESMAKIISDLIDRKTDFAIGGISVTYERFLLATYTTNIRYENMVVLYLCRARIWDHFKIFLLPFKFHVWLTLFGTLVVISLCMIMSLVVNGKNVTFRESFILCIKSIIEQNDSKISTKLFKTRWGPFILFFALLFACMEINTAYKSKLASILIRPPHFEPSSAEELIADGYEITVDGDKLDFYSEMLSVTDPILIFVKQKGVLQKGFCGQVAYMLQHRAAMMNELAILQYYIRYMCPDSVYPRTKVGQFDPDKLRIASKPIRSNPHAWILQPAVPFWKAFDVIIGQLKNGGFLDKWTRDALLDLHNYNSIPYSKNNFPEDDYASLNTYSSSFLIYAIGNIIAMVAYVGECFIFKIQKKKHFKL